MVQSLTDTNQVYYFDGCFSKFEDQVKKNKTVVIWATAVAALLMVKMQFLMFISKLRFQVVTLLIALAMCMMVEWKCYNKIYTHFCEWVSGFYLYYGMECLPLRNIFIVVIQTLLFLINFLYVLLLSNKHFINSKQFAELYSTKLGN